MKEPLRERQEWKFFAALPQADLPLTLAWWCLVVLRSVLPAVFAVATGVIVGAVEDGTSLTAPASADGRGVRAAPGVRTAAPGRGGEPRQPDVGLALRRPDRLLRRPAGHRPPRGSEPASPTSPWPGSSTRACPGRRWRSTCPSSRSACVDLGSGLASAVVLFGFAWWAPAGARGRVAVDALAAAGERRLEGPQHRRGPGGQHPRRLRVPAGRGPARRPRSCGSSGCPTGRSTGSGGAAGSCSTSSRRRPGCASGRWPCSVAVVVAANLAVFGALAHATASGALDLDRTIVFAQVAVGTSLIAFGGLNWALDGAAAPVAAVLRLREATRRVGALSRSGRSRRRRPARPRDPVPRRRLRLSPAPTAWCSTGST